MTTRIDFEFDAEPQGKQAGWIRLGEDGISIHFDGYGEATSEDDEGCPVHIAKVEGQLKVYIWSDIQQDDATHVIDLENARCDRRLPDGSILASTDPEQVDDSELHQVELMIIKPDGSWVHEEFVYVSSSVASEEIEPLAIKTLEAALIVQKTPFVSVHTYWVNPELYIKDEDDD